MEDWVTVKAADLTKLFNEIAQIRSEIKELKEKEESVKAYSIQQTAELLNLHYNSVRKLIIKGKLFAKYLHEDFGKCIVPFWAIKSYLHSKENSNQNI